MSYGTWCGHTIVQIGYDIRTDEYVLIDAAGEGHRVASHIFKQSLLNVGGFYGHRPVSRTPVRQPTTQVHAGPITGRAIAARTHAASIPGRPKPHAHITRFSPSGVIGWRCWVIDRPFLRSCSLGMMWHPRVPMWGDVEDGVGVHAWKDPGSAAYYGSMQTNLGRLTDVVVGTVDLWGLVDEHAHGYRAQWGAVRHLETMHVRFAGDCGPVTHCPDHPAIDELRALYTTTYEHMPEVFVDSHEAQLTGGINRFLRGECRDWNFTMNEILLPAPVRFDRVDLLVTRYVTVTFARDELNNIVVTPFASSRRLIAQWCDQHAREGGARQGS